MVVVEFGHSQLRGFMTSGFEETWNNLDKDGIWNMKIPRLKPLEIPSVSLLDVRMRK